MTAVRRSVLPVDNRSAQRSVRDEPAAVKRPPCSARDWFTTGPRLLQAVDYRGRPPNRGGAVTVVPARHCAECQLTRYAAITGAAVCRAVGSTPKRRHGRLITIIEIHRLPRETYFVPVVLINRYQYHNYYHLSRDRHNHLCTCTHCMITNTMANRKVPSDNGPVTLHRGLALSTYTGAVVVYSFLHGILLTVT